MNRLEGVARRPSLTGNISGGANSILPGCRHNSQDAPGAGSPCHFPNKNNNWGPLSPGEGMRCHNTSISSPSDPNRKADTKRVILGIRDARSHCVEDPGHALATPKLSDANARRVVACQPPASLSSSRAHCSSKFQARSNSFAGQPNHHNSLRLEREEDNTGLYSPSLQYLITRARRGVNKPFSANSSPMGFAGGRRHVKVDLPHHHDLQKAVEELQAFQTEQPDDGDNSMRQAIADVANHCLRQTQEAAAVTTKSRLKRNPSSEAKRSPAPTPQRTPLQGGRNKSRRLSSSTTFVEQAEAAEVSPNDSEHNNEARNTLCLPDPSNIAHRRILFAMSRKMCSRSSIESFESGRGSPSAVEDADIPESTTKGSDRNLHQVSPSSQKLLRNISEVASAVEECLSQTQQQPGAQLSHLHEDDHDLASVSTAESIMSVEHGGCVSVLSSSDKHPAGKQPASVEDDESIAFSMDSVHMRKKQFDSQPPNQLNRSARTCRTDWAVNAQNQVSVKGVEPPSPPQHIVCEFDLTSEEDSNLERRFQFQARLWDDDDEDKDDDDDDSLASLSTLGTAPISGRMDELDPWDDKGGR